MLHNLKPDYSTGVQGPEYNRLHPVQPLVARAAHTRHAIEEHVHGTLQASPSKLRTAAEAPTVDGPL